MIHDNAKADICGKEAAGTSAHRAVRILIVLMIAVMALGLVCMTGCGGKDDISVGISWCEDPGQKEHGEDLQAYINTVEKAGGKPVLLHLVKNQDQATKELKKCDALIMTGGGDLDPAYYGAEPSSKLEDVDRARDASDMYLLQEAITEDMPVLCTCRGMQVLNVYCGGSLIQDIPTSDKFEDSDIEHRDPKQEDFTYHDLKIVKDTQLARIVGDDHLKVNSWHHQAINKLGDELKVSAKSEDGMIEAIERTGSTYVIGVQFHPEWSVEEGDDSFLIFFQDLIDHAGTGTSD